ncbi:ionotropic receptor 75a-like [Contarinia nasturtii]|uniref:ionotropic receptor 75a-like n=1 Tax=Contarinia nasturtii TaxID=265458 RepID=UPI0012D38DEE|nr:ionotropic receptor 75a-like [Contarinia nasturtii]
MLSNSVLKYLLFISFSIGIFSSHNDQAKILANSVRVLLEAIGKPGRLTVMACWPSDFSFRFYTSINNANESYQIVITQTDFINVSRDSTKEQHEFILIDFQCNGADTILLSAKEKWINYFWIIFDMQMSIETEEAFWSVSRNLPILITSEVYYVKSQNIFEKIVVQQLYRTDVLMPLIIEEFGEIINGLFIDYRRTTISSRRRQNLFGLRLKASMVVTNNDTLNHLTDYRETQTDPLSKVNYILTQFLMSYLNATAEYLIVSSWGYKDDKTEEWSGMVGQLVRQEVELGASPLFMTVERVPIIQYIASPTRTGSRFILRSPKLSYTDNVFLLPFDDFVWYCLIVLVIVTAIFLIISVFIEWKYVSNGMDADSSSDLRPSVSDIFFVIFGAACQQGSAAIPRSVAGRIILAVAFTILMFLYTSYSANIVALLQSPSTKIKTLKDLYESRLDIGVDDTVFNRYYFSHAEESMRKKIYTEKVLKKNGQDNFMSLEEGVQRVRQGLFAFHMELSLGYKVMSETFFEDEKCGLIEIAYLQVTDPWYAIKKNSSYKELFKIGLMRMHEHGITERENTRMYTKKPRCTGTGGNFITASLVDTKPALLVLLWGYLMALMVLGVEFFIKSIKEKGN